MDLRIDPEFADKIPPLTQDEYEQLEANILEEGTVINPLIVWKDVIVDGHNRYRIIQKYPEISYTIYKIEFTDRYEAIAWICKNQLGRRNLTEVQKKYLVGKQYEAEKKREGFRGNQYTGYDKSGESGPGQNVPDHLSERTSERIAKEIGVNERYVRRAEEYARGLDAADNVLPGIKHDIFTGLIRPSDKDIIAVGKAPVEERGVLADQLRIPRSARKSSELPYQEENADTDEDDEDEENRAFIPSAASIRAISEHMQSSPNRGGANVDTEFIILELDNALGSMMHRWDTLISDYRKAAMAKDCWEKITKLAQEGIQYFKKYLGENHNENDR